MSIEYFRIDKTPRDESKIGWVDYSDYSEFNIADYENFIAEKFSKLKVDNFTPIIISPEVHSLTNLFFTYLVMQLIKSKYKVEEYSVYTRVPEMWKL